MQSDHIDVEAWKMKSEWKPRKTKKNDNISMKIRRLEIDVEAYHGEAISAREEVRAMKQAMRDMRDEIARLTNKAQYEIVDLE
jgi:cupin superfamily acireductone dioxygenase involved in methionine salvage